MTSEAVTTVGELLQLLKEHNVSDDARLTGQSSGVALDDKVFVSEINLRAEGESTVVLRIGSRFKPMS